MIIDNNFLNQLFGFVPGNQLSAGWQNYGKNGLKTVIKVSFAGNSGCGQS